MARTGSVRRSKYAAFVIEEMPTSGPLDRFSSMMSPASTRQ
jgi:hypothetical protein